MIDIDGIVANNLKLLKQQEEEITKSLLFIQKAIAMFESAGESGPGRKRRGRPKKDATTAPVKRRRRNKGRKKKETAKVATPAPKKRIKRRKRRTRKPKAQAVATQTTPMT